MNQGKRLGLLVLSFISMLALAVTLFSGIMFYLGLFPEDSHIVIGLIAIIISVVSHVLNASVSPMNFISVLFFVGVFWSGIMNIEGKGGGSKMHLIIALSAVILSVLTSVLNLRFYIKEKKR